MVPNSRDKGITGIRRITIKGDFSEQDFNLIKTIFEDKIINEDDNIRVELNENQVIDFIKDKNYHVEIYTDSNKGRWVSIENVIIYC